MVTSPDPRPNTIVLIHGLWMTPRSWENWITHYEARGFTIRQADHIVSEMKAGAL